MENAATPCVVLTTWPLDGSPEAVAETLVRDGLAACVHVIGSGRSVYRWNGAVASAGEQQLLIKTTRQALAALETRVRALHPYEVPEWLVLDVTAGAAYGAWLGASVTPPERDPSRG